MGSVMVWGGVIFTVLMMEGHDFCYGVLHFGVKFGSVSSPCWDQWVLVHLFFSTLTPHPRGPLV